MKERFGSPLSVHYTVSHELHQRRRKPLNVHFSKQRFSQFAPFIQDCADPICDRLQAEFKGTVKITTINDMWAAFATAIVFQ